MRADTLIPLTSTAEFWNYTEEYNEDSGDTIYDYYFDRDINLMVTEAAANITIFARESLPFNGQLRNLKDIGGNQILPQKDGDYIGFLNTGVPVMDVFGKVIGYRYVLTRAFIK